jgi:Transposase IS116/IS110/IS902 family
MTEGGIGFFTIGTCTTAFLITSFAKQSGKMKGQLMSYLGLTPSEYSSGNTRRLGGITKTGNAHARRTLIEGAWAYRYNAKVSRGIQQRQETLPQAIRDIAWKAQVRLCKRYRRLVAKGKRGRGDRPRARGLHVGHRPASAPCGSSCHGQVTKGGGLVAGLRVDPA